MTSRRQITETTLKTLFAKSGNQCAFPECVSLLVENDNLLVGEICHINAVSPNGPRYDPTKDDDYLRSHENLVVLCANHHKRIDKYPECYPPDVLRRMRHTHESHLTKRFSVPQTLLTETCRRLETEHMLATFYKFPQMQTLAQVLQRWTWLERDFPGEALLDTAAWICFVMADGDTKVCGNGLDLHPAPYRTIAEQFADWKQVAHKTCRERLAVTDEGISDWLSAYQDIILSILRTLQHGHH